MPKYHVICYIFLLNVSKLLKLSSYLLSHSVLLSEHGLETEIMVTFLTVELFNSLHTIAPFLKLSCYNYFLFHGCDVIRKKGGGNLLR